MMKFSVRLGTPWKTKKFLQRKYKNIMPKNIKIHVKNKIYATQQNTKTLYHSLLTVVIIDEVRDAVSIVGHRSKPTADR